MAAAAAADGKAKRPPTRLWGAFPLEQRADSTVSTEVPGTSVSPSPSHVRPVVDVSAAPIPADRGIGGTSPPWVLVTLVGATGIALVLAAFHGHAPGTSREEIVRFAELDLAGRIQAAKLIRELIVSAEAHSQAPPRLRLVKSVRALEIPAATEACSIRVWRGYLKSRFLAVPLDGGPRAEPIAESPTFRAFGADRPERTPESARALAELLRRLDALGWSTVGGGPHWFDRRLARTQPPHEGDAA